LLNLKRYIGVFMLCFVASSIAAQNNILELLPGSEQLGYDKRTGAHRLTGTVNFVYQGNTMYCDSAHYFDKTMEVRAYSKVHITKGVVNLFCDSLYYNGKTKYAKLWGHVRVRDDEYKIITDSLEYDTKKSLGIYRNGAKIESITSNETLSSKVGYFYPDSKDFFFSGKVKYRKDSLNMTTDTLRFNYAKQITYFYGPTKINHGKTQMWCKKGWYDVQLQDGSLIGDAKIIEKSKIIKADTLLYEPSLGRNIGKGHVDFKDTLEKTQFYGDYALSSDKEHSSFLTGHVLAIKVQKKDTMFIHADTLFNQNDTLDKPIYTRGSRNVKFYNRNVQAVCDSLMYLQPDGMLEMYKDPIVWSDNSELKGDSMLVFLNDTVVERIEVMENATALMEIDSGAYYNQMAGRKVTAYFRDNDLYQTDVSGNAHTIFYPEKEEETDSVQLIKRLGMNRLYAGNLRVMLDSGEVKGITYYDKPEGVFYPMDKINKAEQFLPNFEWKAALRPKDGMGILH